MNNKILLSITGLIFILCCNKIENIFNENNSIKSDDDKIESVRNIYNEIETNIKNNKYEVKTVLVKFNKEEYGLDYDADVIITYYYDLNNKSIVKFQNIQKPSYDFRYYYAYYFYPNREIAFCYSYKETDSGVIKFEEERDYFYNNEIIKIIMDRDPTFSGLKTRSIFNKPFDNVTLKDTRNGIRWANSVIKYLTKNYIK